MRILLWVVSEMSSGVLLWHPHLGGYTTSLIKISHIIRVDYILFILLWLDIGVVSSSRYYQ